MQRLRVLVGRRRRGALVRDELDDHDDEADEDAEAEDGADGPHEDLAVDDEAAEVDVPLLLLAGLVAGPGQEPALLRLVQLPHQRRPVQVAAAVVVRRRVGVGDLQRPAPGIPPEHPARPARSALPLVLLLRPPRRGWPLSSPLARRRRWQCEVLEGGGGRDECTARVSWGGGGVALCFVMACDGVEGSGGWGVAFFLLPADPLGWAWARVIGFA